MSRMSELDLDRQQIEQVRGETRMILTIWDRDVNPHLEMIESASDIIIRHAQALPIRPDFTTFAQDNMSKAERVLEEALQKVREAMHEYTSKHTA